MSDSIERERTWGNTRNKVRGLLCAGALSDKSNDAFLLSDGVHGRKPSCYCVALDTGRIRAQRRIDEALGKAIAVSSEGDHLLWLPTLRVTGDASKTLWKHEKGYSVASFVASGTQVLAHTAQGELRFFDAEGTLRWSFRANSPFRTNTEGTHVACVVPQNKIVLLSLATGETLALWNVTSEKHLGFVQAMSASEVLSVLFDAREALLTRWETGEKKPRWSVSRNVLSATLAAHLFAEQDLLVLVCSREVATYRWSDGALLSLQPLSRPMRGARFSTDGMRALLWSEHSFAVWEQSSRHELRYDVGHDSPVCALLPTWDGRKVVSKATGTPELLVWGEAAHPEWAFETEVATKLSLSRDETMVRALTTKGLCGFDLRDGSSSLLDASMTQLYQVEWAPNERLRWTQRYSKPSLQLFDAVEQRSLYETQELTTPTGMSDRGACVLRVHSPGPAIEVLWFREENNFVPEVVLLRPQMKRAFLRPDRACFVAGATLLLLPYAFGAYLVLDTVTGAPMRTFELSIGEQPTSPHEAWLGVLAKESLHLWRLPSFEPVAELSLHAEDDRIVVWSVSGNSEWLFVGTERGFVHRYRLPR